MRKTTCFVDLDGVLVDFVTGALAAHGATLPMRDVTWEFHDQIGVEPATFWSMFGFDFWSGLTWTHEGRDLLLGLHRLFPDRLAVLTSPPRTQGAADGKLAWVRREMGALAGRVFLGNAKELLASPGALLLDDHDPNVDRWITAGGTGILVPRPWNARRAETDGEGRFDVVAFLREVEGVTS